MLRNTKELVTIQCDKSIDEGNSDGFFEMVKAGTSFKYEGVLYAYHSSGLCRSVYRSECGKFVIKVPQKELFEDELDEYLENIDIAPIQVKHNYYEYMAYKKCPKKYKIHLAHTELLPNCWLRQEFVEVRSVFLYADLREIGVREDGSLCIFDMDCLLDGFRFTGYPWEGLPELIKKCKKVLNN